MTTVQRVAQIFGIVFILVGLIGFFYTGMGNMTADPMTAPRILGMFPVNVLHNIVHLLFGVWGLLAARTFAGARTYAQIGGVIYLLLAIVGYIAPSGFNLVPLGGNDIWLHALLGVVLAYFGFTAKDVAARPA